MFIAATGMVCPIGLSAVAACAAKRAGISAFAELPYHDNAGEPIVGAAVPGMEGHLRRDARLVELLAKALTDLIGDKQTTGWHEVPLLVGLAESGRPGSGDLSASIVNRVQERFGIQFHSQASRAFATGHTAVFEALGAARDLLRIGAARACIVCGVDSLLNAATLLWLDRYYRLKTSANRDGVIPGEAAAAVLIQHKPAATTVTEVIGLGFAKESAHVLSDEPLLGQGLTRAVRTALTEASIGLHEIDWRLSDATGELYGFKELPLMEARLMRVVRKAAQPLWHWAEAIGDTGAAAGVAQLVLADEAVRKNYAPGDRALCLTSSVPGDRATAVLRRHRI